MKALVLCSVLAMAVLAAAGAGKAVPRTGCISATIGGKHACLKAGQRCKPRFEQQYERRNFACNAGRLVRLAPVPQTPVTFPLEPVDSSGVSGTATLTPLDRTHVKVTLAVDNAPPGDLPAHIHFDTCKNVSTVRYGLSFVTNGKSETTVVTPISYLRRGYGRFSINVHKAQPDLPIIACGDIPQG